MLDFLGIGAQKAGTTWLYERLRQHPQIVFPHPDKEIHFWSRRYPKSLQDPHYKHGLEWYRRLFNHWDTPPDIPPTPEPVAYRRSWFDRLMAALDAPASETAPTPERQGTAMPRHKFGEISPSYCYFEDPATLPTIRDFAPDLRILYITRHPFDRAWSGAQMAVRRAEMRPHEASDQWYIDHFRSHSSRKRGDYARAIREWRTAFSEEQLLVLRFEDIPVDPHRLLRQCCEHIGVDPGYFDAIPAAKLGQKVFAGGGEPLRPSLLPVLHELYDERIATLAADFGIDYTRYPAAPSDA